MTQIQNVSVIFPTLREDTLIKARTVTHSFRQGGPKIKHQVINNKHIFHNYGFGAASVSLAFGASLMSSKGFSIYFDPTASDERCAVIGSGVLGLMTALELIKRGRKVTVYSSVIPELEPKESKLQITSQINPVVWMPKEYDWSEDMLTHQLISKLSYDYLRQSLELSRYQSIKEVVVYDNASDKDDLREVVSSYVCDMIKSAKITYENGSFDEGSLYKTFHINSRLYLEELRIQAILRGVRFVQKTFTNLKEILSLKETAIWNCTNASSSYLFEETDLVHQHYLLLQFDQQTNHKNQFVLKSSKKGEEEFQLQCIEKKTFLIMKVKEQKISNQEIKQKLTEVKRYLNIKSLKAKL